MTCQKQLPAVKHEDEKESPPTGCNRSVIPIVYLEMTRFRLNYTFLIFGSCYRKVTEMNGAIQKQQLKLLSISKFSLFLILVNRSKKARLQLKLKWFSWKTRSLFLISFTAFFLLIDKNFLNPAKR